MENAMSPLANSYNRFTVEPLNIMSSLMSEHQQIQYSLTPFFCLPSAVNNSNVQELLTENFPFKIDHRSANTSHLFSALTSLGLSFAESSNLSTISDVANRLCSSHASTTQHGLAACAPLLQLAVRQALQNCLPGFSQISISGTLHISVESGGSTTAHHSTVLHFDDEAIERRAPSTERPLAFFFELLQHVGVSNTVSSETTKPTAVDGACTGSSKRKSANPIKFQISELPDNSSTDQVSRQRSTAYSVPTSPSADSGVLDLSHNASLAGSAPMTPLKEQTAPLELPTSSQSEQIIEFFKNQMAAIVQPQMNFYGNAVQLNNCAQPDVCSLAQSDSENYVFASHSTPMSPGRTAKRPRIRAASNRSRQFGRLCANRRVRCNQCAEEFPSLPILEEHTMSIHGTYRCHICQSHFTQRSNLQRHALKHVGFKPFECRVCLKAYYRKDHLMRHMETGHPGFIPKENINIRLTSAESLEFLTQSHDQVTARADAEGIVEDSMEIDPVNCDSLAATDVSTNESKDSCLIVTNPDHFYSDTDSHLQCSDKESNETLEQQTFHEGDQPQAHPNTPPFITPLANNKVIMACSV